MLSLARQSATRRSAIAGLLTLTLTFATAVGCSSTGTTAGGSSAASSAQSSAADSATSSNSGSQSAATGARTTYPLTIENCGQQITFTQAPSRVLILNGTSVGEVESFVLLGIEDSILANAQYYGVSDDPEMVAAIDAIPKGGLTSNDNYDVPAEQVLAAKPDLVVSTWSGGFEGSSGFATREQLTAAGINTFVNPANCAFGKTDPSPAEQAAYESRSIESSLEFLTDLGEIFDVQGKAAELTATLQEQIDGIAAKVADLPKKSVLIAYPGMSMATANGLPAVMAGGIYDDIVSAAGGTNVFPGATNDEMTNLSKEQLAAANVDLLALGTFTPDENAEQEAMAIFEAYPQWEASKNKAWIAVSDSVYFGPLNSIAVEKIARAIHPDAGI